MRKMLVIAKFLNIYKYENEMVEYYKTCWKGNETQLLQMLKL